VLSAGIRAVLGRSSMDTGDGRPPTDQEDTETVLSVQEELFDRWHGVEGLLVSYTLRTIFNCSDQLILRTVSRAIERGAVVQMHVAEIPEENEFSLATRGATTIAHLRSLGVLGPHFLGAHATWASDEEIEILAATNTSLSHNAGSNLKILGVPRVAEWLEAGINVAIGTDGAPSNNRMSVIDEMWLASLTQKGRRNDPTAFPAPVMLAMATVNGAKALGLGDLLGRLAPGFAADLVIIDPRTTNFVPVHDPHAGLVNSLKTENVESVMSAGRWLMRGREVLTIDEEALIDEARDRARHIRRRLGLPDSGF
jgi:5-methylthioadenosine/S-adenosylhomocysteine deaminase